MSASRLPIKILGAHVIFSEDQPYPIQVTTMRRIFSLLAITALITATSLSSAFAEDKLDGEWALTDIDLGVEIGFPLPKDAMLKIEGDTFTPYEDGKAKDPSKVKVDVSVTPHTMDITATAGPNKDKTIKAIFEIKDDELKICMPNRESKDRPTEIKPDTEAGHAVMTFKRKAAEE